MPAYPHLARSAQVTGIVSLLLHVDADGWLRIETKSGHPLLTRSGVADLAQVRLSPADCAGSVLPLPYRFLLSGGPDASTYHPPGEFIITAPPLPLKESR